MAEFIEQFGQSPDVYQAIAPGARELVPVPAERDTRHPIVVPDDPPTLARIGGDQPDLVACGGSDPRAIGGNRQVVDVLAIPGEDCWYGINIIFVEFLLLVVVF